MGNPTPQPSPHPGPPAQPGSGSPTLGPTATPSPSPGPTTPGNPLTMYPGIVLQAGRKLGNIGNDLNSVAERIKPMRGVGMHPTAAAAFDLMTSTQVQRGADLGRFTEIAADKVDRSAHVVRWADESSVVAGPGWRPGKPSTFLDNHQ